MSTRRTKGEGSVYRRSDGRAVGEYEDANGRKRYITSRTKTKAQMKARGPIVGFLIAAAILVIV